MREMDWPAMDEEGDADLIARADLRGRREGMGGGVLVSGNLEAALAALAPDAPMLGLGGECGGAPAYGVRIARDRALLVGEAPFEVRSGWHEAGFAATPADDLWTVFTLSGAASARVIAEGTGADPGGGSPSAAVLFAGEVCLLLRRADSHVIAIETPRAWFLARWLRAVAAGLDDVASEAGFEKH